MSQIGASLDPILKKLGCSRAVVAEGIGISRQHLCRIVSGECQPTVPVVVRLLDYLNRPESLRAMRRRRRLTFEELVRPEKAA